ncbi:MAG: glutamine-hydrolyzing GMP synthase [Candidatus Cloacimonas sp.]|nr:glutamine-hydrolyzing GMP synthase [Candidatus Cloacimonadota bacterium]
MNNEMVLILDFGSKYTQDIARATRRLGVYSEIAPYYTPLEKIKDKKPRGLILSGSTYNLFEEDAPKPDKGILDLGIPILGVCYGMQLLVHWFGGKVATTPERKYSSESIEIDQENLLFSGLTIKESVWTSCDDSVSQLPECFVTIATGVNTPYAAIQHRSKKIYALEFHPEVTETHNGLKILDNFLKKIAGFSGNWSPESFVEKSIKDIRQVVGDKKVLLALSGGVDSSVTAALLDKAIGDQLISVFVDTGLMRKNEAQEVKELFSEHWAMEFIAVDAGETFHRNLKGVQDPEQKRKVIGKTFIDVFEAEAEKHTDVEFLAQGTLYPDVIESVSLKDSTVKIKSHHNVGGLPEKMKLKIVEPLRELYKDEVREVGRELGLPENVLMRHPFPGPGLAVRIPGEITKEKVEILQNVDHIFIQELKNNDLYHKVWQAFAVLLPIQSVGVKDGNRTYEYVCALRAVGSTDGTTAEWSELPTPFLRKVSDRIISEVDGVNRIVYDISSKPPATIEWE